MQHLLKLFTFPPLLATLYFRECMKTSTLNTPARLETVLAANRAKRLPMLRRKDPQMDIV